MKADLLAFGAQKSLSTPFAMRKWLILAAMALMILSSNRLVNAQGLRFTVNSTGDSDDMTVGDGICADSNGDCTLRAAIHESNFHAGDDGIEFDLFVTDPNFDGTGWSIPLTMALPDISDRLSSSGPP